VSPEGEKARGAGRKVNDDASKLQLRLNIAKDDFADAKRFADSARIHGGTETELEALLVAAVVCYARPFSDNEPKRPKAPVIARNVPEDKLLTALDSDADRALHARLLELRDKAIAHAESTNYPGQKIPPTIGNPGTHGVAFVHRRFHILSERLDPDALSRIAEAMRVRSMAVLLELEPRRT
jgi:hypothetical protein